MIAPSKMFPSYHALLDRLEEIVADETRTKMFRAHAVHYLLRDHGLDWSAILSPEDRRNESRDRYSLLLIHYGHKTPTPRDYGHALAKVLADAPMFDLAAAAVLANRKTLTDAEERRLGDFVRRQMVENPR